MLRVIREFPIDFRNNLDYYHIIIMSYVAFMLVYRVISPYISSKLAKNYIKLAHNYKIEWNVRFTSTVFSIIVSSLCAYILVIEDGIYASPLLYDSSLVKTNLAIVMGYVMADCTIILFNYKIIGDAFTVIHHFISVYAYSHALTYSVMPYFANFRLIVELSTPLVNMRWFLYACGYKKDSLHFFINGIVMTILFFTVRIASIPVFWYKVYSVLESPLWAKMKHFRYIMIITCLALDIINLFWFRKMFKGAIIVWQSNWQYYEKHHKTQQLEKLNSYSTLFKNKLLTANNLVYQSTRNGLDIIINPSKYIGIGFIERNISVPRVLTDFLATYRHHTDNNPNLHAD